MATHSTVLAWRIPRMGEPGGLLSMGSQRVGHDWRDLAAGAAAARYLASQLSSRQTVQLPELPCLLVPPAASSHLPSPPPAAPWWVYPESQGASFMPHVSALAPCPSLIPLDLILTLVRVISSLACITAPAPSLGASQFWVHFWVISVSPALTGIGSDTE